MRISDWSSDVCSSDLPAAEEKPKKPRRASRARKAETEAKNVVPEAAAAEPTAPEPAPDAAAEEQPKPRGCAPRRKNADADALVTVAQAAVTAPAAPADRKSTRLNASN